MTVSREVTHPRRVRYSAELLVRGILAARGVRNKQLSGHHVVGQVLPLLPTPVRVLLEEMCSKSLFKVPAWRSRHQLIVDVAAMLTRRELVHGDHMLRYGFADSSPQVIGR